jgi:transcriptional regulator with XRE-family HTH domain
MRDQFDHEGFFEALDSQRLSRGKTWKQVAEETGISASTLTRMAQGKRPDVDGLAALLRWSGLKAESFIGGEAEPVRDPLAQISTILRGDPRLSAAGRKTIESVLRATYQGLSKSR